EAMPAVVRAVEQGDEYLGANGETPVVADDPDTIVYHVRGVLFFGAAGTIGAVLDRIADQRRNFVLNMSGVPMLDSTAAFLLEGMVRKAERAGVTVFIAGLDPEQRRLLEAHEVGPPRVRFTATTNEALAAIAAMAPGRPAPIG